jgi:subtilase family serine protease
MRCMAWIRTDIGRTPSIIPSGYSPANLQAAYNLANASSSDGGNQTVVIVDAYDDPTAESDLGVYRNTFGLSACTTANGCFLKVNEFGATSPLPATDPTGNWEAEESLDVDMVSAICPNCEIVLMETVDPGTNNLYGGEDTAATSCGAAVISNSWGGGEYSGETSDEVNFNHPGVMITFAAGDFGYDPADSGYPSGSQYVTSVGGTSLSQGGGNTWTQSAWPGTGSLCSAYIAQPAWQTALGVSYTGVCGTRIDNDVSAVADPNTGVAVYDTDGGAQGCSTWCVFGGTSAAAPIIGGVYALAGNGASLTYGSYPYSHVAGNITDVTIGSNGPCPGNTYICEAGVGFDGPTGLGTPHGIGAF